MSLSPQMRTYLRLLHLPLADLRQAVEDALEENPMLEEVPRDAAIEAVEAAAVSAKSSDEDDDSEATLPDDWGSKDPLAFSTRPQDLSRRKPEDARKVLDFQETLITKPESLFATAFPMFP